MRSHVLLLLFCVVTVRSAAPFVCAGRHDPRWAASAPEASWSWGSAALLGIGTAIAVAAAPGTMVVGGWTLPLLGTVGGTTVATGSTAACAGGIAVSALSGAQLAAELTAYKHRPPPAVDILAPETIRRMAADAPCIYRRVLFATNRYATGLAAVDPPPPANTPQRPTAPEVEIDRRGLRVRWGEALVRVPAEHRVGKQDLVLHAVSPLFVGDPPDGWFGSKGWLVNDGPILMYTHGWQNTFYESLETAAQIAFDSGLDAWLPFAFAWPSVTPLARYGAASDQVAASQADYDRVIQVMLESAPGAVDVVGHSLGTRLVWRSLVRAESSRSRWMPRFVGRWIYGEHSFRAVVLAAADLELNEFNADRARLGDNPACDSLHLWTNENDYALKLSEHLVTGRKRLGTAVPSEHRVTSQGFVAKDSVSHSFFASNSDALIALGRLLSK